MLADPVAAIDFSRQLKAGTSRITVFDQDEFCEPWACGVVKRFAGKSMHQVNLIESYKLDLMPKQESYESDGLITFYRNDHV